MSDTSTATALGPWPALPADAFGPADPAALEAQTTVFGELPLPFLVELPGRGPGADPVGRSAGLLPGMPVDLTPAGWRLVPAGGVSRHDGVDLERARGYLARDLEALALAGSGWTGPVKTQAVGPWTLAARLLRPLGEPALGDRGACRDLAQSLAEGLAGHLAAVRRAVPGASSIVLQLDESDLADVLAGRVRTASGFGVVAAPDRGTVEEALAGVVSVARAAGADPVVVHCPGARPPVDVVRRSGAGALAVTIGSLRPGDWDRVAEAVEAGVALWAGIVPVAPEVPPVSDAGARRGGGRRGRTPRWPGAGVVADRLRLPWRRVGLDEERLADVVVTPCANLAGTTPEHARHALELVRATARDVAAQLG